MREIRTLRATWRGLETWCGSGLPGHTGAPALDPTDERGWETERCRMAQATAPILDSTIPEIKPCTSPASVNANLSLAEPLAPAKDYASDHSQVNTAMR